MTEKIYMNEADDATEEILGAACNALDKAHSLLSFVVRYDGQCTPQFLAACKDWIDGEYDPGERSAKKCVHVWKKTVLDNSMFCQRCGIKHSTDRQ